MCGCPRAAISTRDWRNCRNSFMVEKGPLLHSSPAAGASGAIPLAARQASTQRSATAATSRMTASMMAMRSGTPRATHASFLALSVWIAASIVSWSVDGMAPDTVGNSGVPVLVTVVMVGTSNGCDLVAAPASPYDKLWRIRQATNSGCQEYTSDKPLAGIPFLHHRLSAQKMRPSNRPWGDRPGG